MEILASLSDGFLILDEKGKVVDLNPAAEKLLGQTRHQILHQSLVNSLSPLANHEFILEYDRAQQNRHEVRFEILAQALWLEVQLAPYQKGLLVCLRNITERKQVEAELLESSHLATLEAQISHILVTSHSLSESLKKATEILLQSLNVASVGIWAYNPTSQKLEIQAIATKKTQSLPLADAEMLAYSVLPLENSKIATIANTGQPLKENIHQVSEKTSPLLCSVEQPQVTPNMGKDFVGYPLILEEETIGVLGLWRDYPFKTSEQATLETIADNLAIAIDRAWARTALLSRYEALLFRLANQIRNSLDLDTILGTAVQEIRNLLDVDYCSYLWCWSKAEQLSIMVSHEASRQAQTPSTIAQCPPQKLTLLAQTIEDLKMLRLENVSEPLPVPSARTAEFQALLNHLQISSLLLMPLKTRSNHLGAILCSNSHTSKHWSDRDLELLQSVVDQLAIAIDQAELFAQAKATALAAQTQAQQLELTLQELKRTQSQLIQTEKMSSLGQMVAGIAHEINNPVNFIYGNLSYTSEYIEDVIHLLSLYQKHYPDPPKEIGEIQEEIDLDFILQDLPKSISSMQVGAERIQQIVLSLRNFSRLDQAEMKPVDIHEGIDSTLLILHNRIKAKGDRPEVQIIKNYGQLPKVECYASQLNQVFMNIINNGIDALEDQPEPHLIMINTEALSPLSSNNQNGEVLIRIKDNGSGMDEDTLHHIFDPFFTTKPVGKGTGLGLSITYQIVVEKHGGKIECISQKNQGTEFLISIPIAPKNN